MTKRIDTKMSKTAQMVCLLRAISFFDEGYYKSNDNIAQFFVHGLFKFIARTKFLSTRFKKALPNPGMYEYIVCRTKLIDEIFEKTSGSIEQVLILGAGFDSRAIRFKNELKGAVVFELDSEPTQQIKREKLKDIKIHLPENLKLIPIDFEKETLSQKLEENNFASGKPCLVILEGLTMFLEEKSIDALLKQISSIAGKGSILIFDYLHLSELTRKNGYEQQVAQVVSKLGEKYKFGIEKGAVSDFISKYGFEFVDELNSHELNNKYLSKDNKIKPIDIYSIAIISK